MKIGKWKEANWVLYSAVALWIGIIAFFVACTAVGILGR